mmetsp:Transcript_149406/g.212430  ORF Transcript_149406/g.212430 Transcript_149406/m.212430 type:complete len:87 (+) Transcript_149406:79-339(+)
MAVWYAHNDGTECVVGCVHPPTRRCEVHFPPCRAAKNQINPEFLVGLYSIHEHASEVDVEHNSPGWDSDDSRWGIGIVRLHRTLDS